ncbi:MAG: hypothetical protein ABI415_05890 [Flavitalea sp.]
MKKSFFISCLLLIAFTIKIFSQGQQQSSPLEDDNIYGNPYLLKDWSNGVIRFTSGRVINEFKLKFDCAKNLLMLQFKGSAFGAESKVNEFVIYPKGKNKDSMNFKKGYPVSETGIAETFYQVLVQGKITLLKHYYKAIVEEKKLIVTTASRRYEDREIYYLLQDGIMSKAGDENEMAISRLPDSYATLKELAAKEKIKTEEDLARLIRTINER